jgi:hypothetical protein
VSQSTGRRENTVGVAPLIKDVEFGDLIADKAFDANRDYRR